MTKTWVGLLVIKDRKVLMVRRHGKGYFALPGGTLEPDADPEVTLARELQKELGISRFHASKWKDYDLLGKAEPVMYHFIVYSGGIEDAIQLGSEIAEMRYLNTQDKVKLGAITYGALFPELQHRGIID